MNKLPAPRLELLWDKQDGLRTCTYSLVIPLRKSDLRRKNSKGKDVRDVLKLKIGKTSVDGGISIRDGVVDTPYRDGAHALWDSKALGGIPIYAVYGGTYTLIKSQESEEIVSKKKDKTYHLVLTIEDETTLQTSDLFINDVIRAQARFTQKIMELNPDVDVEDLGVALDEGWYKWNSGVVLYTEPFNIFGKE